MNLRMKSGITDVGKTVHLFMVKVHTASHYHCVWKAFAQRH